MRNPCLKGVLSGSEPGDTVLVGIVLFSVGRATSESCGAGGT